MDWIGGGGTGILTRLDSGRREDLLYCPTLPSHYYLTFPTRSLEEHFLWKMVMMEKAFNRFPQDFRIMTYNITTLSFSSPLDPSFVIAHHLYHLSLCLWPISIYGNYWLFQLVSEKNRRRKTDGRPSPSGVGGWLVTGNSSTSPSDRAVTGEQAMKPDRR